MNPFSIDTIAFDLPGHPLSYIEIVATLIGLVSVVLATRKHLWTWPFGIVNQIGFLLIFFQIGLYANMLLQVYYLAISAYGWSHWRASRQQPAILHSSRRYQLTVLAIAGSAPLLPGFVIARLHLWLPALFAEAAEAPYLDSFIMVGSMLAMWLMAHKRIECWGLWLVADALSVWLYFSQDLVVIAGEYVILLGLAFYGFHQWRRDDAT